MKDVVKKKCKFCGKEIVGTTKKQVEYNLETHIKFKHSEENEN